MLHTFIYEVEMQELGKILIKGNVCVFNTWMSKFQRGLEKLDSHNEIHSIPTLWYPHMYMYVPFFFFRFV